MREAQQNSQYPKLPERRGIDVDNIKVIDYEKLAEEKGWIESSRPGDVKNISQLIIEMRGQVDSLLEEWATMAYRSYKANGNGLAINLKLKIEGDSDNIKVKTGISFTVEKITDEREGEIKLRQEKLL